MRLAHIRPKRRRFIGPGSWPYLLANLTEAVSVCLSVYLSVFCLL